jgi:hypothetical protein
MTRRWEMQPTHTDFSAWKVAKLFGCRLNGAELRERDDFIALRHTQLRQFAF